MLHPGSLTAAVGFVGAPQGRDAVLAVPAIAPMGRSCMGRSTLAARTQIQPARADLAAFDESAAGGAGLAFAIEHPEAESLGGIGEVVVAHAARGLDAAGGVAVARDGEIGRAHV